MISAFDKLADEYWQQFCQDMPVGGGMAYQNRLKACRLDGSLDSLKRLDNLLITIKNELANKAYVESDLLKQSSFRHFVFFVAFYVGQVASHAINRRLNWQASDNLQSFWSNKPDKFYMLTALGQPPIFVLMTIGARLFGRSNRPFYQPTTDPSTKGNLVEDSVYGLACAVINAQQKQMVTQPPITKPQPMPAVPPTQEIVQPMADLPIQAINTQAINTQTANTQIASTQNSNAQVKTNQPTTNIQPTTTIATSDETEQIKAKLAQKRAQMGLVKQPKKQADFFAEVKQDLSNLPAVNDSHQADFVKAYECLQKLAQKKTVTPLSDKEKDLEMRAVKLLAKTAKLGNSSAMIVLAMCYFDGVGVAQDPQKGFAIVQKAANAHDVRAQKLLSRLYYQGLGVNANIQQGELWLQKAADNGHSEAKRLVALFAQSRLMQDDFRIEAQKDKRYLMVLIMVALAGVLAIWLMSKLVV